MKMMKIMCICIVGLTIVGCTKTEDIHSCCNAQYSPPSISLPEDNLKQIYSFIETPEDLANIKCLARNMYFEARGESEDGQIAVANVTLNRVEDPSFPDNVCDVVHQKKQFSWTINKKNKSPKNKDLYNEIYNLAEEVYYSQIGDNTDGALYYHAKRIKPKWSNDMIVVASIDKHIFYRP